uniref:Uncharacterized protein n=1 Tax=Oryza sativa subsp. indica TaxID=39946 RepID=C5NNW3_ORYSI|nr:hypothetical protein [Oryza sativa Indica Group]
MEKVADSETFYHTSLVNLMWNDPGARLIKSLRMIQRFGPEIHRNLHGRIKATGVVGSDLWRLWYSGILSVWTFL